MEIALYLCALAWLFGYICFIIYLHIVDSKPYLSEFTEEKYPKAPSPLNPHELSVLLYKKVVPSAFTASILVLIKKGIIWVQEKDGDYIFCRQKDTNLSNSQKDLMLLLFEEIGGGEAVRLSEINAFCKTHDTCSTFLFTYQNWRKNAYREVKYNFFEEKKGYKSVKLYKNIGFLLILANFITGIHFIPIYCMIIPIWFLHIYFYKIYKRTKEANTEYFKWLGYKNYLLSRDAFSIEEETHATIYGVILGLGTVIDQKLTRGDHLIVSLEAIITRCVRNATLKGDRSIHLPWNLK